MRFLVAALAAFAFGAAAQAPAPEATADAAPPAAPAKSEKVCTSEKPVGSNRRIKVCRSVEQAAAERQAAQDALEGRKGDL